MSEEITKTETTAQPAAAQRFWTMPATQWDVFKFFLPIVLACSFWAVRVEVNQARTDAKFEQITVILNNQRDQFRDISDTLKSLNQTKDERGQRLASIEAKIDVLMGRKSANDVRADLEQ